MFGAPQLQTIGNFNRVVTNLVVHNEQRLFPEMAFTCSGNITQWTYVGGERTVEAEKIYHPMLQIWRQVDKTAYVNSQSTSLFISYESRDRANIHIVNANPPLRVEEGDILGIYQPPESSVIVYYQETSGPINLAMDRVFSSTSSGPAPTSVFGLVTAQANDWPLITIEFISEYQFS